MNRLFIFSTAAVLVFSTTTPVAAHSGGLNAQGCHAGSKPYHCHRPQKSTQRTQSSTNSGCNSHYSGCVPNASDVDCLGGGGNGPAYVKGPIRVLGTDIYGLDRDGDGIACE